MYCWEAAKKNTSGNHWTTAFSQINRCYSSRCIPASQRLCANGPFEDCLVRMFVKQHALPSVNVCEAGLIAKCECFWSSRTDGSSSYLLLKIKQFCSSQNRPTFYIMLNLTLIFYPHHTGMRSQMLYTNGSFEICQERMFLKQRRTHGWSSYLLLKKIFILKQKSSNLYMIGFNSVRKFLSNCLFTLH